MSNRNLYLQLLIYYVLAFFLTSCAAPMSNIVKDNAFTFESIKSNNIVFGGLASNTNTESWDEEIFIKYTEIAYNSLTKKRENISLKSNKYLVEILGYEKLLKIVYALTEKENLNNKLLNQLSNILPDYRYIIFSRIMNDKTSNSYSHNKIHNIYTTQRELTVHTVIYDLKDNKKSWAGVINTIDSNSYSNPHSHHSEIFIDVIMHIVQSADYSRYPEKPTIEGMIKNSFLGIGGNFPDQSCSELGIKDCVKRTIKRF